MRRLTTLDNKIRIVTQTLKDRDSTAVGIWVGVGGRYESFQHKGVAHFIEHMAFKGSQRYSCDEIKQRIEGVGGNLNAFTSEEETCYYAKVPGQHLAQTFDILADISFFPKIAKSDLEKERTVILEEIKMYHDLPQYYVTEILEELLWPNHPLGKSLAGTQETVSRFSRDDLKNFHRRFYEPANTVIAAGGAIEHEDLVNMVMRKLGGLKGDTAHQFLPARRDQQQPAGKFFSKKIEQMHLALGFLAYEINHPLYYALNLLSIILGGNMSSRLFSEVRERRGLAYSIGSSLKGLHDTGMLMIRAGVDNHKIEDALDIILKVLHKTRREGVSSDELKRAKDYFLGQFLLSLEDTMDYMIWLGGALISGDQNKTVAAVMNKINAVSQEDIKKAAEKILAPGRLNVSLIGPLESKQESRLKAISGLFR